MESFKATTLYKSIQQTNKDQRPGTVNNYKFLEFTKGFPIIPRTELFHGSFSACADKSLVSFIQMTDIHQIDSTTPIGTSSLGEYLVKFYNVDPTLALAFAYSFRAYEPFTCQVIESMVQQINKIGYSPITNAKVKCIVNTGDNAEDKQHNELRNFINLMDGKIITPNPTGDTYIGIQDNTPTINYQYFYHPDDPSPTSDTYKIQYGYPSYPNILNSACKPFKATGLKLPWYTCNGNHDQCLNGNFAFFDPSFTNIINTYTTGNQLLQQIPQQNLLPFIQALSTQNPTETQTLLSTSTLRSVPASNKRRHFDDKEYVKQHFKTTSNPGPIGHGFKKKNLKTGLLYYTFTLADTIKGIMLNTCNPYGNPSDFSLAANGSLDLIQLEWLEKKLQKYSKYYYTDSGELLNTKNKNNNLIVIYSHHNSQTLNNTYSPNNDRVGLDIFLNVLSKYPNVILWVNGHTHYNYITPHPTINRIQKGFWEINTASHIEYPQQSRLFDITITGNTLSIFTVLIDHAAPPNTNKCNCSTNYTIHEMASISRELASNNPYLDPLSRLGTQMDRNTQLLLFNPLCIKL